MLLAAVSPDSLFRSADTGKSWGFAGKVFAGQGINNIFASGTQCYVRADSGTMVSSDQGLTWKTMEPQPEGGWNCLLQSGQVLLEGMENGVFNMTLGTTTWTPSSQGLPRYYFNKLGVRDDTLVAAFVSPSGYDMFSRNVNGTWRPLSFFSPGDDEIVKQSQHRMIVDGASRLKITLYDMQNSNDGGATWHICGSTLPKDLCGRLSVSGLFRTDSGIVAGAGVNTMLTKDSGTTWDIVGTAWGLLAPLGSDFFAACWSVWDGTTFRDSLLITTNLGATWSPVYRTNPWNGTVKCFTSFDECLYAGTSTGAFWSTDTGKNWTSLGKDLPAKSVISFCFNKKYSFALLDSGFVYRLERPVSVYGPSFQSTGTAELKSAASITGNRITLSLGSSQHVRIEVFGIDGRQQKILLDGYVQKGTQSFPVYQGTISNSIVLLRVSGNGWSKVLKVARGMQYMR
jgi:photosystem II stability/assembly factor-like uncharacterized protein